MLHYFHFTHLTLNRELKELYLSQAIKAFAVSLIALFVPVYLLQLGYPISTVLLFYAISFATMAFAYWVGAWLMSRIGTKHTIALSVPLLVLFYFLLMNATAYGIPILLIAPLQGLSDGIYWVAYHTDFALYTKKRNRGEAVGLLRGLPQFASILGPLIGALVISTISFPALFFAAMMVFIIAAVPLLMSSDRRRPYVAKPSRIFANRSRRETLGLFIIGMKGMGNHILWPLAIFLTLGSVVVLGEAVSGMLLFMFLLNMAIGRLTDKHNPGAIMRIGGLLDSATWFVKAGVNNALSVFGISAIGGMTETISEVPFWKKIYDRSRRGDTVEYFLFMEMMLAAGRIFVLLFIVTLLASNIQLALLLVGIGALGYLIF